MKKGIADLWKVFIEAIRQIQEPLHRYAAGLGILFLCWLVIYSLSALVVHGVIDLVEVIGNTIVNVTGGEVPEKI